MPGGAYEHFRRVVPGVNRPQKVCARAVAECIHGEDLMAVSNFVTATGRFLSSVATLAARQ